MLGTQGMKHPKMIRVLPTLLCPICGTELKEFRAYSILAWVCDCQGFIDLSIKAERQLKGE